jgi:hypothetical protein
MKRLILLTLSVAMASAATAQTRIAANTARPPAPVVSTPQLQVPPEEAQIIMIRSTLVALSQANQTNNYAVLNALGSTNFRVSNPPGRLAENFAAFRANRIDLAPVTLVMPRFTAAPRIENGKLKLTGYFPTAPMQVNFDLGFEPADGSWRLFGLSVNLNRVPPK